MRSPPLNPEAINMNSLLNTAIATTLAAAALSASPAALAVITLDSFSQPGAHCQPAREYPDARIRQSEIDNIGNANVYVVCSSPAHYLSGQTQSIQMIFLNSDAVERTVRCTLQNRILGGDDYGTVLKEAAISVGDSETISFSLEDTEEFGLTFAGIQCILPPQVSMGYTYLIYEENDDVTP